jgi:hypothetical protein
MNETNLTEDKIIQDFLESVGATEKDIIKRGNRAVDLSTIPQSEHHL